MAVEQLESEAGRYHFTTTSEANLLRIFTSIYDRTLFFSELPKFPHHAEIIVAIPASSNYLTDIVVRNPEYLYQLFDQEYLAKKIRLGDISKEIAEGINRFKYLNTKLNYLRQFKKRITLKIGVNDILHFDELIETTEQLSILASAINAQLFALCFDEIKLKYMLGNLKPVYSLCSLGKCGGLELNYSSDVDLLLFYDVNESYPHAKRDYHEILSETVQLFAKSSSDVTPNGYIYRVDFRLRPDGKYSPLCKALDDYIKYYEARGEDWERQMLIKLDFVGGDKELYNKFHGFVTPYVFQSTLSASIKDKIKEMKQNIERHYNKGENVKTFRGGIRDIEFTIQALQLLYGGKYKTLRSGNSLITLKSLADEKLISPDEYEELTGAYIFYRRIEHFLQLMNDTQTHLIPEEEEVLLKICSYLQLKSIQQFKDRIEKYRNGVRKIYDRVLLSDSKFETEIQRVVFRDSVKAEKNILYLRSGQGILERKEFDSRTIGLFNSIEPQLLAFLNQCSDPDRVIENFVRVVRNSKIISFLYQEFQNKKFFESTLKLFYLSQKSSDLLSLSTQLEEYFITRKSFIKNLKGVFSELSLEQLVFALTSQFTLNLINSTQLSELLSSYIEFTLQNILINQDIHYKYFVAGLGSFGCSNMNFSSDVDLIVVAEDISSSETIQQDFQKFLSAAVDKLRPFEVDFRLRPEGKKSPLVWDLKNYVEYLNNRARIWELQSLTKIRFVNGDMNLFKKFNKAAAVRVEKLNEMDIKSEIKKMHSAVQQQVIHSSGSFNIKKEKGGLLTLDFIVQYLCLRNKSRFQKAQGKSYKKILKMLESETGKDYAIIKKNYEELKKWELVIQNLFNTSKGIVPSNVQSKKLLAEYLALKDPQDLDLQLKEIIKTNIQLFEKYLGG